jgi:hypothetical protein
VTVLEPLPDPFHLEPMPPEALERIRVAIRAFQSPVNVEALRRSIREAGEVMRRSVQTMVRGLRSVNRLLVEAANSPENVAAVTAMFQVRAGLDPTIRDVDDLHRLVAAIMAGRAEETLFLTRPHRAGVAAVALRSWVRHREPASTHTVLPFGNSVRVELRPIHRYEVTAPR